MPPYIRHITPVDPSDAEGVIAEVARQGHADLGAVGATFSMLTPAPELLTAMWALLRESLLVGGPEERAAKEVVALSVAVKNSCRFCIDAHGVMLHALGEHELAETLSDGGTPREYAELAEWVERPGPDGPFGAEAAPRFIGTLLVFEFITRMVKVMATNVSPHPSMSTKLGRSVASRMIRSAVRQRLEPGLSLPLLEDRPAWLEEVWPGLDLSVPAWAGDSPSGRAYAQLRAVASCGRDLLSDSAARAVEATVARDRGRLSWPVEVEGLDGLPPRAALGARVAAKAALDPGSLTDREVEDWRSGEVTDHCMVMLASFGAMLAVDQVQAECEKLGAVDA